jgi:hypothetical protein
MDIDILIFVVIMGLLLIDIVQDYKIEKLDGRIKSMEELYNKLFKKM